MGSSRNLSKLALFRLWNPSRKAAYIEPRNAVVLFTIWIPPSRQHLSACKVVANSNLPVWCSRRFHARASLGENQPVLSNYWNLLPGGEIQISLSILETLISPWVLVIISRRGNFEGSELFGKLLLDAIEYSRDYNRERWCFVVLPWASLADMRIILWSRWFVYYAVLSSPGRLVAVASPIIIAKSIATNRSCSMTDWASFLWQVSSVTWKSLPRGKLGSLLAVFSAIS